MNQYNSGSTIRLKATFKDFDGVLVNPALVKVIFYDNKYNVESEHVLTDADRDNTGAYNYDFVTPKVVSKQAWYEWYAEIDGKPACLRRPYRIGW